tara:strand:- start:1169 stop:1867 length:699 start_codon:yes stop_codon:yes gene_type:complete
MAKVGTSAVKIIDNDSDVVSVTSNRLDVNAYLSAGSSSIDIGDVSLLLGGSAASVNNGTSDSTTLRVTIASDTTGVLSVDDNGSSLTVDNGGTFAVQSTLQAGSATIGKLAANSGVDIGDVDVTSISAGTNIIGKVGHDITGGADGVKTVTNAGTDEALASSTACKKVDIQAQTDNTGLIAVGFSGVDATEATGTGIILYAGDTYSLEIDNLNSIYIDSTVSGEGVRYTYFT